MSRVLSLAAAVMTPTWRARVSATWLGRSPWVFIHQAVASSTNCTWVNPSGLRDGDVTLPFCKHGPTARSFTLRHHYSGPDAVTDPVQSDDDRLCPAGSSPIARSGETRLTGRP